MTSTILKTPIVYYGGKTSMVGHLLDMVPEHDVYTEVFLGGATLFFAKRPARNETINDRLDMVVNFYRVLKRDFRKLKKMIDATLIGRSIYTEALNTINLHKRGITVDRINLAWAFWVCTNFAYSNKVGGGYKYSNDKSTCVPDTLSNRKALFTNRLVQRIEHAYIENDDALKVLKSRNVKKAFHYLDPPYPGADNGHYTGYTWEAYEALLKFLGDECKGKFLLSNYNSELLDQYILRYGWHKKEITMKISGSKSLNSRRGRMDNGILARTEVLVSNYKSACGTIELFNQPSQVPGAALSL